MKARKKHFRIATKLPKFDLSELPNEQINNSLQISLNNLGINKID